MKFSRFFCPVPGSPSPSPCSHPSHFSPPEFLWPFLASVLCTAVHLVWNPLFFHFFFFLWVGSMRSPPHALPGHPRRVPPQRLAHTTVTASLITGCISHPTRCCLPWSQCTVWTLSESVQKEGFLGQGTFRSREG